MRLPRIYQIVQEINRRFCERDASQRGVDDDKGRPHGASERRLCQNGQPGA